MASAECRGLKTQRMATAHSIDFVALDVETASAAIASICQLGMAFFEEGRLLTVETHLVRPRRFAATHTAIHGIDSSVVTEADVWEEVYARVRSRVSGKVIVSHTLFDRRSIFQACCRDRVAMFSYLHWIDSCQIARQAWPELESYSLGGLARHHGIRYRAHDAGEDARVAGKVYLLALKEIAERGNEPPHQATKRPVIGR